VEKMEKKYMERLVGKYCKVVTKEPGEERASVVTGTLEDVDYKDGFILVDSSQGLGCLRINTVIAIKPASKRKHLEKRQIKEEDKAMVGIGTLIVFIAMILVAAVAASVIIQTSERLQQRAQSVGTQTIREVSSGMVINNIIGYTNAEKTRIEYLALSVRARAGSKDIDLGLVTLTVLYDNLSILTLNTSLVQDVNTDNKSVFDTPITSGSSYTILNNLTSRYFGVIAVHDEDDTVTSTNGINGGDRVYIVVNLSALIPDEGGLPTRESISGEITPETGAPGVYDVTAPAVYSKRIVDLW
jgi:flagellin FlaB